MNIKNKYQHQAVLEEDSKSRTLYHYILTLSSKHAQRKIFYVSREEGERLKTKAFKIYNLIIKV